eukprot:TRINITY_DN64798_c0_g1_i1.p1 TRINITY_DN64798_c0_g1~~TRINITY_DN64798_c0_g1_i1.p1  ORF type:complete len:316 (+),score=53.94 TRINITY_DN64798_c0_g1_i1:53-1000(+)
MLSSSALRFSCQAVLKPFRPCSKSAVACCLTSPSLLSKVPALSFSSARHFQTRGLLSSKHIFSATSSPALARCQTAWHSRSAATATFTQAQKTDKKDKVEEDKDEDGRVWHLPPWAREEQRPPLHLQVLGVAMLIPLAIGAIGVHVLALNGGSGEELLNGEASEELSADVLLPVKDAADYSRTVLNWSIHYAGALLSVAGASHWGMQLAELGVPRRSDYMGLYYLCRFSAPAVFVFFGWVASVLSTALPTEATMWLLVGFVGLFSCDFLACAYRVTPAWWFRWRAGFGVSAMLCILLLMFSERNLYLGQKPKLRM